MLVGVGKIFSRFKLKFSVESPFSMEKVRFLSFFIFKKSYKSQIGLRNLGIVHEYSKYAGLTGKK